jgi:hypothetical protein
MEVISLFSTSQGTQTERSLSCIRFEVFTAVTMKNVIFWDVTLCSSCNNRCFGGTYHLHHQGDKNQRAWKKVNSN